MGKKFFSTAEIARILNISRVAVFKKIKTGQIKAEKIGRNYVVRAEDLGEIIGNTLSENKKQDIERAVGKTVKEYRRTLELLGKE